MPRALTPGPSARRLVRPGRRPAHRCSAASESADRTRSRSREFSARASSRSSSASARLFTSSAVSATPPRPCRSADNCSWRSACRRSARSERFAVALLARFRRSRGRAEMGELHVRPHHPSALRRTAGQAAPRSAPRRRQAAQPSDQQPAGSVTGATGEARRPPERAPARLADCP